MEVRSDTGVMPNREPFLVTMQKQNVQSPSMQNMRLTFTPDGTAVYKPVTSPSAAPAIAATTTNTANSPPPNPQPQPQTLGVSGSTAEVVGPTGGGGGPAVGGNGPAPMMLVPSPHGLDMNMSDPLRKKRGRPRKYGPDGAMALQLPHASPSSGGPGSGSGSLCPWPSMSTKAAEAMKKRGRPSGPSSRKLQLAALGSLGTGFTPHVITVKAGEDVSAKIMSFSQNGPRAICILSANGAISHVTLRQAATSGGTVTYEGRFEILSLSGSFLLSESGGQRSRTGGLSVSLAYPDGRVLGGGVAGLLTAASPVQIVVGSFIIEKKREQKQTIHMPHTMPAALDASSLPGKPGASWHMPVTGGNNSPPSRGTLSESSSGGGGGGDGESPMNHSTGNTGNNSGMQPMPNMPWK